MKEASDVIDLIDDLGGGELSLKKPAEETGKVTEESATKSLKKPAMEMLKVVRKSPSISAKASSKGGRCFERKSSATRMREKPIAATHEKKVEA